MSISAAEIEQIIQKFETSEFDELSLKSGETHLRVLRRGAASGGAEAASVGAGRVESASVGVQANAQASAPAPAQQAAQPAQAPAAPAVAASGAADGHVVVAGIGGLFYHAPSPTADPFVQAGSQVEASDTVGLIEVMKLFTSVTAGVRGEIVEFLAENGANVAKGTPLVRIREV